MDDEDFKGIGKTRYTMEEAANKLGVSAKTFRDLVAYGYIPYIKQDKRKYIQAKVVDELEEIFSNADRNKKYLLKILRKNGWIKKV